MINRPHFFAFVRDHLFHNITQSQVDGCSAILDAWERQPDPTLDIRWLAYMLATAWWETAHTMQPIEEFGKGHGRAYGAPVGPWHHVYCGRGDVQITWLANYRKATERLRSLGVLKLSEDMVENPDLAMRPDVAAAIMIRGMESGWFTGKKLADYIHGNKCDYVNARRIINGLDKAKPIAQAAALFEKALKGVS